MPIALALPLLVGLPCLVVRVVQSPNDYANIWLHKHKILARQERRPHLRSMLMDSIRLTLFVVKFMQRRRQVSHILNTVFAIHELLLIFSF